MVDSDTNQTLLASIAGAVVALFVMFGQPLFDRQMRIHDAIRAKTTEDIELNSILSRRTIRLKGLITYTCVFLIQLWLLVTEIKSPGAITKLSIALISSTVLFVLIGLLAAVKNLASVIALNDLKAHLFIERRLRQEMSLPRNEDETET